MTPPTHPETEKLIAEFDEEYMAFNLAPTIDVLTYRRIKSFLRKSITTSFASGRAQGAKMERERIRALVAKDRAMFLKNNMM